MIFGRKKVLETSGVSLNDPTLAQLHQRQAVDAALTRSIVGGTPPWLSDNAILGIGHKQAIKGLNMEENDIIVRKVRNGYNIIVVYAAGSKSDIYVATDLDAVAEVLKVASVNRALDRAAMVVTKHDDGLCARNLGGIFKAAKDFGGGQVACNTANEHVANLLVKHQFRRRARVDAAQNAGERGLLFRRSFHFAQEVAMQRCAAGKAGVAINQHLDRLIGRGGSLRIGKEGRAFISLRASSRKAEQSAASNRSCKAQNLTAVDTIRFSIFAFATHLRDLPVCLINFC